MEIVGGVIVDSDLLAGLVSKLPRKQPQNGGATLLDDAALPDDGKHVRVDLKKKIRTR